MVARPIEWQVAAIAAVRDETPTLRTAASRPRVSPSLLPRLASASNCRKRTAGLASPPIAAPDFVGSRWTTCAKSARRPGNSWITPLATAFARPYCSSCSKGHETESDVAGACTGGGGYGPEFLRAFCCARRRVVTVRTQERRRPPSDSGVSVVPCRRWRARPASNVACQASTPPACSKAVRAKPA
jgi:hypothetical protein